MPPFSAPRPRAALLALALLAVAAPAAAQSGADGLADELVRLRSEVEQRNSELELLREEQRTVLAGLNAQKAELEAGLERQRFAATEARGKLEAQRQAAAEAGLAGDALAPQLHAAIDRLQAHVSAGLPFKRDQRLASLAEFRTQLDNGSIAPERAVNRLWAFFEDEFRLTRENGLHSQTIELDGERVLAEVAKLGSMLLYFRTQDGDYGRAVGGPEGWRFERIDGAGAGQVAALFDSLRKQIRQGYFELPLAAGGAR